ncbi:hypothetical protein RCL1_001733 [Eukaryota sp. TZLM3-RCL]
MDIRLTRTHAIYQPGEVVDGFIVFDETVKRKHMGITIKAEGSLHLHSTRDSSDSLSSVAGSTKLLSVEFVVQDQGKLPDGPIELPFQLLLEPLPGQRLFETYSGVYVSISYTLTAYLQGGLFGKSLEKSIDLFIYTLSPPSAGKSIDFVVSRESLLERGSEVPETIPDFLIEGHIDDVVCDLCKPLTGHFTIKKCESRIKSIDIQLLRVETVGKIKNDGQRESTEIMNLQLAADHPPFDLEIPLFLLFPKMFVCSTTEGDAFRLQFQLNLTVTFENNLFISEAVGLKTWRSSIMDIY